MPPGSRLPLGTTLAVALVLSTTVRNLVRLATAMSWEGVIDRYSSHPGAVYVGLTGGFWAAAGLAVLWSFWRRAPWARTGLVVAGVFYAAWVWLDRLVFRHHLAANWPFDLAITVAALAFVVVVWLDGRRDTNLGKEAHEREFRHQRSA